MDPMIAVALLALGVGMGWAGHGLWSARQAKAKHQKLMADLRRQFAMPQPLKVSTNQLDPEALARFTARFEEALQETPEPPRFASGGWISAPQSGGDSIPFILSEGGRLLYPHGDHSGPTAMDADKITFTVPGKTPELPPSHDTPQNREIMERMNEPGSVQERQGDDRG